MRSYLPAYELIAPRTLDEVLNLLQRSPGDWKLIAGGTDLMVLFQAGQLKHRRFVSIWQLSELRGIHETSVCVTLGALTTYTDVLRNDTLRHEFPLLCRAASETGGIATQNRGTLGGNIANASPAADSPPVLLAYDAELELVSTSGSRWVPYQDFHTGYKLMQMRPDELIRGIRLQRSTRRRLQYFRKVGTRRAQAISKVCMAGVADVEGGAIRDIRIALGSVAPTVIRCTKTEAALRNRVCDQKRVAAAKAELMNEICPIDDMRSTARYRSFIANNLLQEFLRECGLPKSAS